MAAPKKKKPRPKDYMSKEDQSRKLEAVLLGLRRKLPLSYACDVAKIPRSTVDSIIARDESFRVKVMAAKGEAIQELVETTEKQSGAWKLLKNLGKEEFKEVIEYKSDDSVPLVVAANGEQEEI